MFLRYLVCVVLFSFSSITLGQETEDTDLKIRRLVDRYNTAMGNADYDTAEAIAIGAAAKYGAKEPIIEGMLFGAANASRENAGLPKLQAPDRRPENVDEILTLCIYPFKELPIWSGDGTDPNLALLEHYLAAKLGPQELPNVKMLPDHNSMNLVVRASNANQKVIAESLKNLSAGK